MNSWTAEPGGMEYDDERFGADDRPRVTCVRCGRSEAVHPEDTWTGSRITFTCDACWKDARDRSARRATDGDRPLSGGEPLIRNQADRGNENPIAVCVDQSKGAA